MGGCIFWGGRGVGGGGMLGALGWRVLTDEKNLQRLESLMILVVTSNQF